jgi:hypothetical protein
VQSGSGVQNTRVSSSIIIMLIIIASSRSMPAQRLISARVSCPCALPRQRDAHEGGAFEQCPHQLRADLVRHMDNDKLVQPRFV